MMVAFKITTALLQDVRKDLHRPHPFAHERVGFISAGVSSFRDGLILLAREYRTVPDTQYLRSHEVGAMMGPHAIRDALQWAMQTGSALFHVHTHRGRGIPQFSGVDFRENGKFVPDFFKVAPQCPHGAIVLSDSAARGHVWLGRQAVPLDVTQFCEVGVALGKWRPT